MLTSKQRAYLRKLSNGLETIFHVGKNGVTPELTEAFDKALEKKELIKSNVLDNSLLDSKSVAITIAERTHSEVVQIIGNKFILFRQSKTKPVILLPTNKRK